MVKDIIPNTNNLNTELTVAADVDLSDNEF